jgi:hypothetical protein
VGIALEQLDYIYEPSSDVAGEMAYLSEVLGAHVIFAIDDGGTRVAMLQLGEGPPRLLLADHLEGERAVYIYRVADLDAARAELRGRGWREDRELEIPMGPCTSLTTAGGHRIALYQLTRPGVARHFEGRRDF